MHHRRPLRDEVHTGICGRTLNDHVVGLGLVMCSTASWLRSSERAQKLAGVASAKNLDIFIYYCYIHVLLIKTNSMIYNMLYKI
jgi:hypothetical protein